MANDSDPRRRAGEAPLDIRRPELRDRGEALWPLQVWDPHLHGSAHPAEVAPPTPSRRTREDLVGPRERRHPRNPENGPSAGEPRRPRPRPPETAARWPLLGRFLPIFTDFSDFLGRLHPRRTRLQKPPITLGVEESSSPRRVLHV